MIRIAIGLNASETAARRERAIAAGEVEVLVALRHGDEGAFEALVRQHQEAMLRVASIYLPVPSIAEETVQEAWLAFLQSLNRFEGRASLKTWIFRILVNLSRTRRRREARTIPFAALLREADNDGPAVDPSHFIDAAHGQWPGHWIQEPATWSNVPEERLLSKETLDCVHRAIENLPVEQRKVIVLRDVEGWTSDDVCRLMRISPENQRVRLHRARSAVRRRLEAYLGRTA